MTPKHKERIENLLASLDDYKFQADFPNNDFGKIELNAIYTLERSLVSRLEEPVEDD